MEGNIKLVLRLKKGGEIFVFRWTRGNEYALLEAMMELAANQRTSFDWFDAAVLCSKLEQILFQQADSILESQPA